MSRHERAPLEQRDPDRNEHEPHAQVCQRHDAPPGGRHRPEALAQVHLERRDDERRDEAAQSFEAAVEKEPDYVEAWNNLGNVQSELGLTLDAQYSYQRALAVAPDYADAHFNLAETLHTSGDIEGAKRHWREYLARDPQSRWADEVRARLQELEPTS